MGVRVFMYIKPLKFVAELQGKMCRLTRLTNINFSIQGGLKANFHSHAMHDGGAWDTSYRGNVVGDSGRLYLPRTSANGERRRGQHAVRSLG